MQHAKQNIFAALGFRISEAEKKSTTPCFFASRGFLVSSRVVIWVRLTGTGRTRGCMVGMPKVVRPAMLGMPGNCRGTGSAA
jgi:hypothetical protein